MNTLENKQVLSYIKECQSELITLIKTLVAIPAPSFHEANKAQAIIEWLHAHGASSAYIDEAGNVIYHIPSAQDVLNHVVFMAHMDTVFTDLSYIPIKEEKGLLYAPGVGDNTANAAVLMLLARYVAEQKLAAKQGVLFVWDTGEEGLGNLVGARHLFRKFSGKITTAIALDGTYEGICNQAVGSLRYEVEILSEGGHSYAKFGNHNAIAHAANMIQTLYSLRVPQGGKSTYNVGVIAGGTSVNTIAQKASFLFEYRSDVKAHLAEMNRFFESVVKVYGNMGIIVHVKLLGERPCMGELDEVKQAVLIERCMQIMEATANRKPHLHAGSTDCNIPFSLGINAACLGAYLGGGAHTTEEYIELDSLEVGCQIAMRLLLDYFHE